MTPSLLKKPSGYLPRQATSVLLLHAAGFAAAIGTIVVLER
jgi:hypothetical protein